MPGIRRPSPSVANPKSLERQPEILRLRLPRKNAANSAQDDKFIVMRTSDSPLKCARDAETGCVLSSEKSGNLMKARDLLQSLHPPATKGWSRSRVRGICPRRHLRVLPTRTRPSLFASD